jgi:hypothetical protein
MIEHQLLRYPELPWKPTVDSALINILDQC